MISLTRKKNALSDFAVLVIVAVLGVVLFFVLPRFLSKKNGGQGQAPADSAKAEVAASASSDASLTNYNKAYQIGTSKAKAAQAAAGERNSGY